MTYSNNFEKIKWDHIDGSIIGSRRDLREHEKKHNVRQVGNDWTGSSRPPNWDSIKNGRS